MNPTGRLTAILLIVMLPGLFSASALARENHRFSDAEIESLLAPVALYPDNLLTQILVAATYPLDIVEAARFVAENPARQGSEAVIAAAGFDWDSSVKTLTAFPDLLARMNAELRWTRNLGEAFLMQREAVMVALQTLRQRARLAGTFNGSDQLTLETQGDRLALTPPRPDLVYVPWYDPNEAFGEWPQRQQAPVYWNPPSQSSVQGRVTWGSAVHLAPHHYPTRVDWHRHGVIVDRHRKQPWQHRDGHWKARDRQVHRDDDSHGWPQTPTASLSQQQAGAIDTRTASQRLRTLQAEAAASARSSKATVTRHFAGSGPTSTTTTRPAAQRSEPVRTRPHSLRSFNSPQTRRASTPQATRSSPPVTRHFARPGNDD